MFYLIIMALLTSMIATGMYWVRQLNAEHMHVRHFIVAQQERELMLNALTYSIDYIAKEFRYKLLPIPWDHTVPYENKLIVYHAENKNRIKINISDINRTHTLQAELYIEYLSNNKKRCTLHMIPQRAHDE